MCCYLFFFFVCLCFFFFVVFLFFQAEDGIRDLVRSRGLGDVYKRQAFHSTAGTVRAGVAWDAPITRLQERNNYRQVLICLLYTSDAADERSSVDLGGRRIIKKKTRRQQRGGGSNCNNSEINAQHTKGGK